MIIKTQKDFDTLADANGNVCCTEALDIRCDISARGYISTRGDISAGGNISARGDISARCGISTGGYISTRGDVVTVGFLFWPHAAPPQIEGRIWCKSMVPPEWQREYWGRRTCILMDGCYDKIIPRVLQNLDTMLLDPKWTETERMMLESFRNFDAEPPDWAKKLLTKNRKNEEATS